MASRQRDFGDKIVEETVNYTGNIESNAQLSSRSYFFQSKDLHVVVEAI